MSDSAEALPDAQSPAEMLEVILNVGQRLAGMNAEWWGREHFRPSPDSGGAFVVIDPHAEAAWHRRQAATEYRDALRLQALRICAANPSLPAPPPATHDAEADINERLAQWCLDQRGHQSATRADEDDAASGTASLAKSWLNVDSAGKPYWPTVAALLADLKPSLPTYLRAARRRQRLTFDQARELRRLLAGLDQVEAKRSCISTEDRRTYEDGAKRLQIAFAELVSMEGLDVAALRRELRQRFSPAWCAYLDLSTQGLHEETYVRVHRDAHFYTAKVRAKQRLTPKEVDRLWSVTFSHLVFQARPPEVAEGDRRPTIEQEVEPAYRRLWRVTPALASLFGLDSAGYLADLERRGFWFRFHQLAEDATKREQDMAQVRFQFEAGAVTLKSGEVFSPAQHAADRWEVEIPCAYEAAGCRVELLYQTADDQFIGVTAHIGPRGFYSEDIDEAGLVSHDDARAWLQQNNFMLPDCLMKGMKTFPAVPRKKPKASEPADEPRQGGNPPAVNIGNWDEGGKAFAEAFKTVNGGGNTGAEAPEPKPETSADDEDDEQQAPALTKGERMTLAALATFDPSRLASAADVSEAMPAAERRSERTTRLAINKLVKLDLAERPEGEKQGARLTIRGRRLATKIAD